MSSVIKPVCESCGTVNERKWTESSLDEQTIHCKMCSNTFDIEVVDYPVEAPTVNEQAKTEREFKESRAEWYAELYKPFVPASGH